MDSQTSVRPDGGTPIAAESGHLPITVNSVCYAINGKHILHDLNFTLTARRRTIVLGANGAGKSVLLRLLHGLLHPSSGSITNRNNHAVTDVNLRRMDAMLFQRPVMLRRTVISNVIFGVLRGKPVEDSPDITVAALAALNAVGLSEIADRPARVLSGGEQQRVAFARAMVRRPELLFLDEPTASLDPQSSRQIEAMIVAASDTGMTIVMTTHNLAQAKRLADDVIFLHNGRVAEITPAQVFFAQPRSAEGRAFIDGEAI